MSTRIGLWSNTSGTGKEYLHGVDKEAGIRYFVFKNENGRRLVSKPLNDEEAKLKDLTDLKEVVSSAGVNFLKGGDYAIFVNDYYEEGSKQPNFNLVIG